MKLGAATGAAVALPLGREAMTSAARADRIAESALPAPYSLPFRSPSVLAPVRSDATTDYYRITMKPSVVEMIPGLQTPVWGYEGQVPGPTLHVRRGRRTVVRQVNRLPEVHPQLQYVPWTSTHLHGSASLPQYDGYASDRMDPGQWKDYVYPNHQPARTLWYHDHGLHHTAQNVNMGLAGLYLLHDELEDSLPLPTAQYDVPLVVADKMFHTDGTLLFDRGESDKGFYGDVITVNGVPWPTMKVARRKYRFRILNASVARSFSWYLDNGASMQVVATDAGLVPAPITVTEFRHAPAERYEVVIDFSKYRAGTRIALRNRHPRNTEVFTHTDKVMAFEVTNAAYSKQNNSVPAQLYPGQPAMALAEAASVRTRTFDFARNGGQWTINGTTWEDVVASGYTFSLADPVRDDVEIWEFRNDSGGWHHPVHIHLVDFKVLSRNGQPPLPYERGGKDVLYLGEYETVRVLMRFEGGDGRYMMHCHNLVHEDHDMMAQFDVRNPGVVSDSPLSVPAQWLPEPEL